MKVKLIHKIRIDLIMTILLLCQMAYMLIGETVHEWLGTVMFLLFILHQVLNEQWYKNLLRGNYTPYRVVQLIVILLLLLSMLGLMVSGIILSRVVFAFLPIHGGMGFARTLHMLAAYWGFIFMSIHLGLHWGMILGVLRKRWRMQNPSAIRTWVLRILAILLSAWGVYAFAKNNIADYLFLRSQFVFFDVERSLLFFWAEYLAMMGLFVFLAYYLGKGLQKLSKKGRSFGDDH